MGWTKSRNGVPYGDDPDQFVRAEAQVYIDRLRQQWRGREDAVAWALKWIVLDHSEEAPISMIDTDDPGEFFDLVAEDMFIKFLNINMEREQRYGPLSWRRAEHVVARTNDGLRKMDRVTLWALADETWLEAVKHILTAPEGEQLT
jgi:hypothetical protein